MPSGESKHGSNSTNTSNSNNSTSTSNSSHGHNSTKNDRHKYCLLCDRNDFPLEPFDTSTAATVQTIYKINVSSKENRKMCRHCFWMIRLLAIGGDHERFANLKMLASDTNYWQCMKSKYKRYVSRIEVKRDRDTSTRSSSKTSHQRAPSPKNSSSDTSSSSPSSSPLITHTPTPKTVSSSSTSSDRAKSSTTALVKSTSQSSTTKADKVIVNKTTDECKEKSTNDNAADKQMTKSTRSSTSKALTPTPSDTVKSKKSIEVVEEAKDATQKDDDEKSKSPSELEPMPVRAPSDKYKPKVPTNTSKTAIIEMPMPTKSKSPATVPNKRQRGAAFDAALRQADDATNTVEKTTPTQSTVESAAKVETNRVTTDSITFDGRQVVVPNGILGTKVFRSFLKLRRFNPITLQPAEPELRRLLGTKRPTIPKSAKDSKKTVAKAADKVKSDVKVVEEVVAKKEDAKVPIKLDAKSNVKPSRRSAKLETAVIDMPINGTDAIIDLTDSPSSKMESKPEVNTVSKHTAKRTPRDVSAKRELPFKSPDRSSTPKSILHSRSRRDTAASAKKHVSFTGISSSDSDEDKPLKVLAKPESETKHTPLDNTQQKIEANVMDEEESSQKSICDKNIESELNVSVVVKTDEQPSNDKNDLQQNSVALIEESSDPINVNTKLVDSPEIADKREKKRRKTPKHKRNEQIVDESENDNVQYSISHCEIEEIPLAPVANEIDTNNRGKRKRTKSKAINDGNVEQQTRKKSKRLKMAAQRKVDNELTAMDELSTDEVDTIKEVNVEGILKSQIEPPPLIFINEKSLRSYGPNTDPLALNSCEEQLNPIALPAIVAVKDEEEKRVSPLKIRINRGKVVKVEKKKCDKQKQKYIMSNVTDVIEAVATGICGIPEKRLRKKKELPADFVAFANDDDDDVEDAAPINVPTANSQRKPRPRSKRTISHEMDSQTIESEVLMQQHHFENDLRTKYGVHLFDAVVQMNQINEPTDESIDQMQIPNESIATAMLTTATTTTTTTVATTTFDDNLLGFIGSTESLQHQIMHTSPDSMCDLAGIDGNEMPPPTILLNTHDLNADGLIQITDKCNEPCAIQAPTSMVTAPSVNMVNVGTGTESPTATVDSTTSGYSQGTLTVYALGFPFNANMNGMAEMTGYTNQLNPLYEDGQYYLQTDNIGNCVEPLEQINQEDIISVLGRTHDTGDLNMDTAINIATFEAPSAEPARTVYLVDCNSLNFAPSLPNIGILRTKANVKQIYQPVQLTTTNTTATTVSPQQLNLINDNYCNSMLNMSHELSTKLLRHDNPLLNIGSHNFDETVLEIQQAANISGDTMVSSTETTSATPRRNGLNILFTTPTKHTSGEDIQFEDLFINESQQQLLNAENFPTTTTSDEPQFNLYGDAFT